MKNNFSKIAGVIISCLIISACDNNFDNPVGDSDYSNGNADFSEFVSIGDSLTAGFADDALYLKGQENSYPAILAQQFAKVGGGEFTQPLVSDNFGGLLFNGNPNPDFGNRLVFNAEPKNPPNDLDPKGPEPIAGDANTEVTSVLTGSFNNMSVPGAKSFHMALSNYGDPAGLAAETANPYFVRFASVSDTSMIADAAAQQPSFFVLWAGNNDLLSYATSGGIGTDQTRNPDPTTYGPDDITDPGIFTGVYNTLVNAFISANDGVRGVLMNLPDASTIPYFTTVPYNAVPLDQATADELNDSYSAYNDGVAAVLAANPEEIARRTINFVAGQNAVVILDEDLTDISDANAALTNMRQATADDLLVLPVRLKIGTLANPNVATSAWGIGVPLEDGDVLTVSEKNNVNEARLAFNASIKDIADDNDNLIFVDAAAIVAELSTTGIDYGTGFIDATYATGGAFSLDGIHPTARGYAVIANRIIVAINTGFNANIPAVNPGDYTTIFVK